MKVVIDTSVAIDYLRRGDSKKTLYMTLSRKEEFVMSLVTVAELYAGRSAQKEEKQKGLIEEMLRGVEVIIPSLDTAKEAGKLRAEYQLSLGDAFVAALALDLNVPLATLDVRDFKKIDGLKMLPEKR